MNQKKLNQTLNGVVEDCVNKVGVDLNTASVSLLGHVSGVKKTIAKNIVAYREANGRFYSRKELLDVAKLGLRHMSSVQVFLEFKMEKILLMQLACIGILQSYYETIRKGRANHRGSKRHAKNGQKEQG